MNTSASPFVPRTHDEGAGATPRGGVSPATHGNAPDTYPLHGSGGAVPPASGDPAQHAIHHNDWPQHGFQQANVNGATPQQHYDEHGEANTGYAGPRLPGFHRFDLPPNPHHGAVGQNHGETPFLDPLFQQQQQQQYAQQQFAQQMQRQQQQWTQQQTWRPMSAAAHAPPSPMQWQPDFANWFAAAAAANAHAMQLQQQQPPPTTTTDSTLAQQMAVLAMENAELKARNVHLEKSSPTSSSTKASKNTDDDDDDDDSSDDSSDDDGSSDGEEEEGHSKRKPRKKKGIAKISAKTVESLVTDLHPDGVVEWKKFFSARMRDHDRSVKRLFKLYSKKGATVALDETKSDSTLRRANKFIARTFLDCLKSSSTHVANFKGELAELQLNNGIALLTKLDAITTMTMGIEKRVAQSEFDAFSPLKTGMKLENVKRACSQLQEKFKLTSKYNPASLICMQEMLIEKMPNDKATKRKELLDELYASEFKGTKPWPSTTALIGLIGMYLAKNPEAASAAADPAAAEAAAARAEAARLEAAAAKYEKFDGKNCLACGQTGHIARNCKSKCTSCKEKNCKGNFMGPAACLFKLARPLTHEDATNFSGRMVTEKIFENLQGKHKLKHPTCYACAPSGAAEVAAAAAAATEPLPPTATSATVGAITSSGELSEVDPL